MAWKALKPYFFIYLGLIVLDLAGTSYFSYKSAKKDFKKMVSFLKNIFAGLIGGVIVILFVDLKTNDTTSILTYILFISTAMLLIGWTSYLNTCFFSPKKANKKRKITKKY